MQLINKKVFTEFGFYKDFNCLDDKDKVVHTDSDSLAAYFDFTLQQVYPNKLVGHDLAHFQMLFSAKARAIVVHEAVAKGLKKNKDRKIFLQPYTEEIQKAEKLYKETVKNQDPDFRKKLEDRILAEVEELEWADFGKAHKCVFKAQLEDYLTGCEKITSRL